MKHTQKISNGVRVRFYENGILIDRAIDGRNYGDPIFLNHRNLSYLKMLLHEYNTDGDELPVYDKGD